VGRAESSVHRALTVSCSLVRRSLLGRAPGSICPDIPDRRCRFHPPGYISPCHTDSNGHSGAQTLPPGTDSGRRTVHRASYCTCTDCCSPGPTSRAGRCTSPLAGRTGS
uniref:Uncharacterized protein n=1 Tax=Pelusios castaneus TaxID=367368 RepID=A0A8C8R9W5_9SAUR